MNFYNTVTHWWRLQLLILSCATTSELCTHINFFDNGTIQFLKSTRVHWGLNAWVRIVGIVDLCVGSREFDARRDYRVRRSVIIDYHARYVGTITYSTLRYTQCYSRNNGRNGWPEICEFFYYTLFCFDI